MIKTVNIFCWHFYRKTRMKQVQEEKKKEKKKDYILSACFKVSISREVKKIVSYNLFRFNILKKKNHASKSNFLTAFWWFFQLLHNKKLYWYLQTVYYFHFAIKLILKFIRQVWNEFISLFVLQTLEIFSVYDHSSKATHIVLRPPLLFLWLFIE